MEMWHLATWRPVWYASIVGDILYFGYTCLREPLNPKAFMFQIQSMNIALELQTANSGRNYFALIYRRCGTGIGIGNGIGICDR